MAEKKVAVIGGGLGGLAAALRLRVLGFEVDLFEKNYSIGGKANQIVQEGFRFDSGPSLLTMPFVLEELFHFSGEKLENYISLKKLEVLCKYFFPDSTIINAYSDTGKFVEEIDKNTADNKESVKKYLDYCERIYDLSAELFLFKSFSNIKTFLSRKAINTLINIRELDTNRSMHGANSHFFRDEKTIQLFDRYATYNGSNPYQTPATLNIIQHVEYNLGGYIAEEGIYSIPKAIEKAAIKKGVNIFTNSNVDKILVDGRRIKGLVVNGEKKKYEIVVSNSDVKNTYLNLLNDEKSRGAKKYKKMEMSSSALVFYWGVKGVHDSLEIHNIIFSNNYEKEFHQLFNEKTIPDDPTIYIYISSKFNKNDAPANCENWFVMINTPYAAGQNWKAEASKIRDIIIKKVESTLKMNLSEKIITESILTPDLIEKKTSSLGGSIYGISSNNKMAAFMRQQNRSKNYKGLYFCGGSAHPGGGIPLVLLSGKLAAEQIMRHEN